MKYSNLFASVAIASIARSCHAMPYFKRATISDTDILNVALTLEHLENAFYNKFLSQFSASDFTRSHLPPFARGRFEQIGSQEKTHVTFLTTALNSANVAPVQPCTYNFPVHSPQDFVAIAAALETVGTSAYSGAAKLLANKDFVQVGAVILATEARHSSFIQSAVRKQNPWSVAFETALDLNQAFTLASQFIVSCPASNPTLPVTAFAALSVTPANAKPGQSIKLSFSGSSSGPLFAVFLSGLDTKVIPVGQDMSVQIPSDLLGTVYLIVTNDSTQLTDEHTVAGPALLMFPFNSGGALL